MAKAKKLPSGSWRCLVYDYTDAQGKRHYESFTALTKKEAEFLAAEYSLTKKRGQRPAEWTLSEAINEYLNSCDAILSPTTIAGYQKIQKNSFQELMDIPIKKISNEMLQTAVNAEAKRPPMKRAAGRNTISPKTVKNNYGLLTAVLKRYHPTLNCTVKLPALENNLKELIPPEDIAASVCGTDVELPCLLAMWLSFSMSEIRGLTKSKSLQDPGYITIHEVVVDVGTTSVRKRQAKTFTRIRRHRIPPYIQSLIDATDPKEDILVPMSGQMIYRHFSRALERSGLQYPRRGGHPGRRSQRSGEHPEADGGY